MQRDVPLGRLERVVQSPDDSVEETEVREMRRRKKQRERTQEGIIDSGASKSEGDGSRKEGTNSDELRSLGEDLGSSDTHTGSHIRRVREEFESGESDPNYIPPEGMHGVEDMEVEDEEVNVKEIEEHEGGLEDTLEFTSLESLPLTEREDGYFYTKDNVQYKKGGREGRKIFYKVVPNVGTSSIALMASQENSLATLNTVEDEDRDLNLGFSSFEVHEVTKQDKQIEVGESTVEASAHVGTASSFTAFRNDVVENYTEDEDGFFYDQERIRYERVQEEGQFTYRLVTSIFEPTSLSPTLSQGVLMSVGNAAVDETVDSTYVPSEPALEEPMLH